MTTGSIVTPASVFDTAKTTVPPVAASARRAGPCAAARDGASATSSVTERSAQGIRVCILFIVAFHGPRGPTVGSERFPRGLREALGEFEQAGDGGDADKDQEDDVHTPQNEAATR